MLRVMCAINVQFFSQMKQFRISTLLILLLGFSLSTVAQDATKKGYKKVVLNNGYEVFGDLIDQTTDSTIISVEGIRLAYHNSTVKQVTDATKVETQKAARTKKKSGVDTLELNVKALVIMDQAFGSMPGYGGQLSLALPMAKNMLRLEFGLGAEYFTFVESEAVTFNYFDGIHEGFYNSEVTVMPITLDLGLSFDFLAKKASSLSLYVGSSTLFPIVKNYSFVDGFSANDDEISYKMNVAAFSGIKVGVDYGLSLGAGSWLTLGYSFSYLGGSVLPNGSSIDGGSLIGISNPIVQSDHSNAVYTLRSKLGGLHGFSIGYRHAISMIKKKKKDAKKDEAK